MRREPARSRRLARSPGAVTALAAGLVAALVGCDDPGSGSAPAAEPPVGQRIEQTVRAELGGVPLTLEVADEPSERAVGLMGRTEVPPGTGMVFDFAEPVETTFYMFQVQVPLTAVFIRDGVVIDVQQMPPCTESDPARCPLYGPDEPFDTVVETAPATLPDVRPGDRFSRRQSSSA